MASYLIIVGMFLSINSDVNYTFFVDIPYEVEKVPPLASLLKVFLIRNGFWILSEAFSVSIGMIM